MDLDSSSLDFLNDDALEHICEQLDDNGLLTLAETYKRAISVCSRIIENRKKGYLATFNPPKGEKRTDYPPSSFQYIKLNDNLIGFLKEAYKLGFLRGPNGERARIDSVVSGITSVNTILDLLYIYISNYRGLSNSRSLPYALEFSDPLVLKWFDYTKYPERVYIEDVLYKNSSFIEQLSLDKKKAIVNEYADINRIAILWELAMQLE